MDQRPTPALPRRSTSGLRGELVAPELPQLNLGPHFQLHPIVFPAGALIVAALVLTCFVLPGSDLKSTFVGVRDWVGNAFGWLYVSSMTGMVLLVAWLALGRFGSVKLGRDDDVPEFTKPSWFAMLFSAGMGIGLLFFSVAEPINHIQTPPPGIANGMEPARLSMAVTIFHWGLHPWALYAVVGLALAYFGFRRGLPLSFRSLLYPLLGDRVWGRTGDLIDTLAIIATLTGVATSLGIGARQVNAGLSFLFGITNSVTMQIWLIAGITAIATVSVVMGLDAGIRRLSEINIGLSVLLMVFVIFGGGLVAYLRASIENAGSYLQILPFNSFRTGAFSDEGRQWLNTWTVFYWAWWISWSPFVGMFIARVSKGRTIREFVMGVLLVPTAFAIAWLSAFGGATLRQHSQHLERLATEDRYVPAEELPTYAVAVTDASGAMIQLDDGSWERTEQPLTAVEFLNAQVLTADGTTTIDQVPTVLFSLLEGLFSSQWLVSLTAGVATLCIVLFFVTSSDSASMVIDIIASGGNPNPPVGTRLFWAITEGLVASALLIAGGLTALQAASITAALPLTIIILLACYSLLIALFDDEGNEHTRTAESRTVQA